MTPHLFAEASRRMTVPRSWSFRRASGVRNEFAPSTITRTVGSLSSGKNRRQFLPSTVSGLPPAGMKRSAGTGLGTGDWQGELGNYTSYSVEVFYCPEMDRIVEPGDEVRDCKFFKPQDRGLPRSQKKQGSLGG